MHEKILRTFFEGRCSAIELREDLAGTVKVEGDAHRYAIEDMDDDFQVRSEHLARVCDAVLAGDIEPEKLQAIGFCLVASDHFHWDTDTKDGEAVSRAVIEWSAPEINYTLNLESTLMFLDRFKLSVDV